MNEHLAVIFDMDGVLVDSYQAHYQSWQRAAASIGRSMSLEEFDATFGRISREIIAALWPDAVSGEEDIARLDARKEAAYREILAADFPPMPGVTELLKSLDAAGFALAIGSSGPPENVALVLDRLGGRALFGAVVDGMDVTRRSSCWRPSGSAFRPGVAPSWRTPRSGSPQPRRPGWRASVWSAPVARARPWRRPTWWSIRSRNSLPRCLKA
jgi:beta-phosphoglucomutase-like phosphatase (HAD superfamily)